MFNDTAARVQGLFYSIARTPDQPLTFPDSAHLALVIEAHPDERPKGQLEIIVYRRGGAEVGVVKRSQLRFVWPGGTCPKLAHTVESLAAVRVPAFGDYRLAIVVDGAELGRLPFRVVPAGPISSATFAPPRPDPEAAGVELKWAHMLGAFDRNEFRAGIITDIVEYFHVPPGTKVPGLNLKNFVLALGIEAAPDFAPTHNLSVQCHPAEETPKGDPHTQTLNLVQLSPERLGVTTWVPLAGLGLVPGAHIFDIAVDDQPLGSIDFHVIAPPQRGSQPEP